ncbi:hypothetical protein KWAN_127 [Erwinia phage vB_EamM_Kwan]|uniref:Uncharacterized protein n=1 Tax=Erwinia phage vB_EamM_Kwan TaxID=1883374 RepID=A0A1B2IE03_9CAUD|nr:hypothetical protein BIZ80_gp172 [Erwinia phage vB_EamM_Kwan]ANZ49479.1 hypothetical protein KWAN_127 [Erwinia phage vB_EamM_Kwan]
MLTPVQSLLDVSYAPAIVGMKDAVEQFLTTVESVPFDQFAYLNENLEVEQLAICFLDADVVSVVIQGGLDKAAIKSLTNYYTNAVAVRVYYSDQEDFPKGDDWSVEGLSFLMDNPAFDESLPAFEAEQDDVFVTIKVGDKAMLGTLLSDLNTFSVMATGEYQPEMENELKVAMAYCNGQECRLLVQVYHNSWIKPMLDMGFEANRWILKADFNHL